MSKMKKYFIYNQNYGYLQTPFKWNGNFCFARPYSSIESAKSATRRNMIELPIQIQELDFDDYMSNKSMPKTVLTIN